MEGVVGGEGCGGDRGCGGLDRWLTKVRVETSRQWLGVGMGSGGDRSVGGIGELGVGCGEWGVGEEGCGGGSVGEGGCGEVMSFLCECVVVWQ